MEKSDEIVELLETILKKLEKIEGDLYQIKMTTQRIDNNTR